MNATRLLLARHARWLLGGVWGTVASRAATWVRLDDQGQRNVYLSELSGDSMSGTSSLLASFFQSLQGGFPSVPLRAAPDGALLAAWLDTRDKPEQDDQLVIFRRDVQRQETRSTHPLVRRSLYALDLAGTAEDLAILLDVNTPDDAAEVRRFQGKIETLAHLYDAPGVRDRYRAMVRTRDGYAMAGVEARVGGTATVKLQLQQCAE